DDQWPIKPDIVLEGGNMALDPIHVGPFEHEALLLLTTNSDFHNRLLTFTKETSAATALAARMAAIILAEYPDFWHETVRGLLIHSAEWTSEMLRERILTRREIANLLRVFGYGVPQLPIALYSARNSLTLISEASIKPYLKEGGEIKTNEMHLHELPWPSEVLADLGETPCEMRVTLSYFVEPNPTRRSYKNKYRYASHGLRFDTKTPTESSVDFRRRINRIAREEVEEFSGTSGDSASWLLGPQLRTRGSIHSDVWRGTASELAEKGFVAIYPVSGWWRDLKRQERWDTVTRYSLIVTIQTQAIDIDVDIYTPVANLVLV
ncbi:MAG: S8 family serine peptidase, partial [Pyrinomonadaceae bacterium]